MCVELTYMVRGDRARAVTPRQAWVHLPNEGSRGQTWDLTEGSITSNGQYDRRTTEIPYSDQESFSHSLTREGATGTVADRVPLIGAIR